MQEYVFDYASYKNKIKNSSLNIHSVRTNQTEKFGFIFVIFLIIFLLATVVLIKQKSVKKQSFYFVQIGEFGSFLQANKQANQAMQLGGAGYIYFDNNFHTLVGFYLSYDDAEKVSKNIIDDFPNAKVFEISTQKFSKRSQPKITNNLNTILSNLTQDLYQLSVDFDTNKNFKNTHLKLSNLTDNFNSNFDQFKKEYGDDTSKLNCKKKLNNISQSLSRICEAEEAELPQKMKYELINIVVNYTMFLNEISQ